MVEVKTILEESCFGGINVSSISSRYVCSILTAWLSHLFSEVNKISDTVQFRQNNTRSATNNRLFSFFCTNFQQIFANNTHHILTNHLHSDELHLHSVQLQDVLHSTTLPSGQLVFSCSKSSVETPQ